MHETGSAELATEEQPEAPPLELGVVPAYLRFASDLSVLAIDPAIPLLTMVNNHHEHEEWVLKENDRIGMFPPIGGG